MQLSIETMNAGTPDEFERVFIRCGMGHDLRSLSLDNLRRYPVEFDGCDHYEHRTGED